MRLWHPKLQFCHKLILLHCLGSEVQMLPASTEVWQYVFNENNFAITDFYGILMNIDFVRLNVCAGDRLFLVLRTHCNCMNLRGID